jgi:hypothetical protein
MGKRKELFSSKLVQLTPCTHTNTIPDFIIPSLFKIVYDEEKKK